MSKGRKGRRHKPRPPRPKEAPSWCEFEGRAGLYVPGEAWAFGFCMAYVERGFWRHKYFARWRRVHSAEVAMNGNVASEEAIAAEFGRLPALPAEAFA